MLELKRGATETSRRQQEVRSACVGSWRCALHSTHTRLGSLSSPVAVQEVCTTFTRLSRARPFIQRAQSVVSSCQMPRCTLEIADGVRYEGRMCHGKRKGMGTLYVDEGEGRTSALRVRWDEDTPHGPGSFTEPDGGRVVGRWQDGELTGLAHEEHPDGSLRFLGSFAGGLRNGDGVEVHLDGGCLVGHWVEGELHGTHCAYLYPCDAEGFALVGEWRHGRLHRAHPVHLQVERPSSGGDRLGISHSSNGSHSSHSSRSCRGSCRGSGTRGSSCSATAATPLPPPTAVHPALDALINVLLVCDSTEKSSGGIDRVLNALLGRRDPRTREVRGSTDVGATPASLHPSFDAMREDPYEAARVLIGPKVTGGDGGEGLFAKRRLAPGEVAAFFGGVRTGGCDDGSRSAGRADDQEEGSSGDEGENSEEDCGEGGPTHGAVGTVAVASTHDESCSDSPPSHVDPDWGVQTADGSWVWLPPHLRSSSAYTASRGHKANHAGWRANCELVDFEHPVLGCVKALRVRAKPGADIGSGNEGDRGNRGGDDGSDDDGGGGVAEGTELTVSYNQLVGLRPSRRPDWLRALLAEPTEDGYYSHVAFSPPRTLFSSKSCIASHGRLRVVGHGPWRVLWFDGVEQGMTCHDETSGALLPTVVGFDYQRTMVAAAVALAAPSPAAHRGGKRKSHGEAVPAAAAAAAAAARGSARRSFRTLLVGLGAGSCASAVSSLLEASSDQIDADVVVVENDEAVLEAARTVHGLRIHREGTAPRTLARGPSTSSTSRKTKTKATVTASSHRSSAGGVRVVLSDAADFMASIQPASVDCILLDAYDAKGNVPAHLQAEPFLAALGAALAPGGGVIANLWNGTPVARELSTAFAARLRRATGADTFGLRVVGHEKNRILVALSQPSKLPADGRTRLEGLQARLQHAADTMAQVRDAEALCADQSAAAALTKTMQANARYLQWWGD